MSPRRRTVREVVDNVQHYGAMVAYWHELAEQQPATDAERAGFRQYRSLCLETLERLVGELREVVDGAGA